FLFLFSFFFLFLFLFPFPFLPYHTFPFASQKGIVVTIRFDPPRRVCAAVIQN
ncbi:hypothetical protein BJX96DRAFT_156627, partial [Aspergillus floccosus]